MKSKKGFTLIELLAVIVILAIIALIAVPIVLNMISQARKSAARSSALGYVDSIEYYSGFNQISNDAELNDYNVPLPTMTNGQVTCTKTSSGWDSTCSAFFAAVDEKSKGDKPKTATIVISSSGKVLDGTTMKFGKYDVNYDGKDATIGGESSNTTPVVDNWDRFYYLDTTIASGNKAAEATTLDSSWKYYARKSTSTNKSELCQKAENGDTVCWKYVSPQEFIAQSTMDSEYNYTLNDGYLKSIQQEFESKGTTCEAGPTTIRCGSCVLAGADDGDVFCFDNTQTHYCYFDPVSIPDNPLWCS